MSSFLSRASTKKSLKYGIPFLVCIIGGSFGLKEFSQIRYQFSRKSSVNRDEFEALGIGIKKAEDVTLESEYEKIKQIDIEHWENIRGPRPWEEQTMPDKVKDKITPKSK